MNGDGDNDIVMVNCDNDSLTLYANHSSGNPRLTNEGATGEKKVPLLADIGGELTDEDIPEFVLSNG